MRAKLPVGNGIDLHGFHRFGVPVKHMEIDLGVIRLHLQASGINQIILFHPALPCDLGGHFFQGKTFFHSDSLLSYCVFGYQDIWMPFAMISAASPLRSKTC